MSSGSRSRFRGLGTEALGQRPGHGPLACLSRCSAHASAHRGDVGHLLGKEVSDQPRRGQHLACAGEEALGVLQLLLFLLERIRLALPEVVGCHLRRLGEARTVGSSTTSTQDFRRRARHQRCRLRRTLYAQAIQAAQALPQQVRRLQRVSLLNGATNDVRSTGGDAQAGVLDGLAPGTFRALGHLLERVTLDR